MILYLLKIQDLHISDFWYWLNFSAFRRHRSIKKPLFLHTFYVIQVCLFVFFFGKEWRQFKQWKSLWYFDVIPFKNVDRFLLQDNVIFVRLSLKEWFAFQNLSYILKQKQNIYPFFNVYHMIWLLQHFEGMYWWDLFLLFFI